MIRWFTRLALVVALVAIDHWSKLFFWTEAASTPPIIRGVLEFTHHENRGAIANLPIPQWLIIGATVAALLVLVAALMLADRRRDPVGAVALVVVLAGAIGNLWDRLTQGFVFDWILLFQRSIINAADIFIAAGLLIYFLKHKKIVSTPNALDDTPKIP